MTGAVWRDSNEDVSLCDRARVIFVRTIPSMNYHQGNAPIRLGLLCLLALPGWLQAQASADGAQPAVETTGGYLQRMDSDGDGRVSLAEYQAWMGYAFTRMDRNGDGRLSVDELPGGRGQPISQADHLERVAQRFARQDADGDGFLSARELAAPPR
jgi:hypothetical protein